jgi:CheY-like chemotaxis protein
MGIKQEEQTKIFEPFQQADMSPDKKDQGTGLGLAITKKILELMGGTLALESEYGKGSTFYFELLLPCEQEQPEDSEEADPESIEEQTVFTNKKILIAEDNPINMHYVQAAITMFSKDIHVIKAKDGKEAYHLYREHNPDLIIMDIRMPHVDGYHATAMIRAQDKQVPIIAMTAKALIEDKEKCLAAGMNDFLSKPVSLDQLKETVEKYLVRR